ncbi:MAG: SUMF1/EgtB/PvdO family nonheme iron enzyme [Armatimonadetes bacterium]|nr:SUMF1/EgtB/PvdO family nonheme iron enzyme [Armatimonadota bacterium]
MLRQTLLAVLAALALCPHACRGQAVVAARVDPKNWSHELLAGPETPADFPGWIAGMRQWREQMRTALDAQLVDIDTVYNLPELYWTQRSFVQPQMMAHDRFFYDPAARRYTVDRYLDDVQGRYGGIDSVLVWPTYPNIGVDDRNQYDLTRDMPGGLPALQQVVQDFHRRGVRVLFPLNPWDNGTRDEGAPHSVAIARLLAETGADGFNGDTMTAVGREYFNAGANLAHPIAVEPENGLGDDLPAVAWDTLGWGYWGNYQPVPGVDRYKWLQPRHLTHVCDRWTHDRTDELQYAWFNGDGYESWENVWGIWNGMTPRDAEALRRLSAIVRAVPDLPTSPDWEPHTPTLQAGVYASKFPGRDQTLWTLVNRESQGRKGAQIVVPYHGETFYDLWRGVTLRPRIAGHRATLSFEIEPHGFGAVLATSDPLTPELSALLPQMQDWARTPLASLSHEWKPLPQQMVSIPPTPAASAAPPGMVLIPATDRFVFQVNGIEVEQNAGVDVQYFWEDRPYIGHRYVMPVPAFYMDKMPVSNADFKRFLDATHYHPADDHNFLRDWVGGTYPSGWANKPVTWVSLDDARAYARWAGKRLPHEWEWQYAAQGRDGRPYPWGHDWNPRAAPPPDKSRTRRPPTDGGAFPAGASPFGILDMVGNVWQWTDEYQDAHTRAAVLRGGSYYQPQGSGWYFPQAYRLDQHAKYLLMAPSLDRAGTIGFRCVADAVPGAHTTRY